jgi:hypothetical protein
VTPKCVQCKHVVVNEVRASFYCSHPENSDPIYAITPCEVERGLSGKCSPVGYNFAPKPKEFNAAPKKKRWWSGL